MELKIKKEYQRIHDYCKKNNLSGYVVDQSIKYEKGLWESYLSMLQSIQVSFEGKVVVDFGCKYGHLLPLFITMGAKKAIGIDVEADYIETGKQIFEHLYVNIEIVQSESGYIPLQPESVDFVLMNEVISHINPIHLETVYSEISRILMIDGIVFISDGNNMGNLECRKSLTPFYEAWENGPDGKKTDRDVVTKCYRNRRKEIIKDKYPGLDESEIDHLSNNTSGLFGKFLANVIDEYIETGRLIKRPYRKGLCPTNPSPSGVVMERGFFPVQVELALVNYGFNSYQVKNRPSLKRTGLIGRFKDLYSFGRYVIKRTLNPHFERTESANLQIIGIKKY